MTICKLKSGEIVVVYSDNTKKDNTLNVYPISKYHDFDVEFDVTKLISCDDVVEKVDELEAYIKGWVPITGGRNER